MRTLVRITPENVNQYLGHDIIFRTRDEYVLKRILRVADSGQSIGIDHHDLHNQLQIVTRKVYVIVETAD